MFTSKSFFVSRAFCKIWRQMFVRWAFWFRRCLGALLETPLGRRASFLELRLRRRVFFENYLSFFKAEPVLLAWQLCDPQAAQSILVMVRQQLEWKLHFRTLGRSSEKEQLIVVAIGTSPLRWSMVQKRKKHKEVIVWLCEASTLYHPQNQRVFKNLFPRPDIATVLHFAVFMY